MTKPSSRRTFAAVAAGITVGGATETHAQGKPKVDTPKTPTGPIEAPLAIRGHVYCIPTGCDRIADPEDLQAHYNLMLCYNGLGDEKMAKEHEARYLRFKADEAAQTITGPYRLAHPEDNNERQNIHEHVSVALTGLSK